MTMIPMAFPTQEEREKLEKAHNVVAFFSRKRGEAGQRWAYFYGGGSQGGPISDNYVVQLDDGRAFRVRGIPAAFDEVYASIPQMNPAWQGRREDLPGIS